MARPQGAVDEESIGSLLVPDSLSRWAWMFGYAALVSTILLATRLPGMEGVVSSLETQPGVPIGTYILTHLFAWLGAGPVIALQAMAGGSVYVLVRELTRTRNSAAATTHLLGVAAILSPAVVATALGDVSPDMFVIPAVAGLVLASDRGAWAAYFCALFALILFTDISPLVLSLAGLALILEGKYSWGALALALGLIVTPGISLLLTNPPAQGGWITWYLRGLPPSLTHDIMGGRLLKWLLRVSAWKEILFLLGPLAPFLALSKRIWTPWWIPLLVLVWLHLADRGTTLVGWGPLSLAAAGFMLVVVARAISGLNIDSLGRAKFALVGAPSMLTIAYVLSRHIGV